jgi:hypothetical protein
MNKAYPRRFSLPAYLVLLLLLGTASILLLLFTPQIFASVPRNAAKIPPTPELSWYAATVTRTRAVGAALTVAALGGLLFQSLIRRRLSELLVDIPSGIQSGWRLARQAWQQDRAIHHILVLAVLLIGAGIRVALVSRTFTNDEARAFNDFAAQPLLTTLSSYTAPANHIFQSFLTHIAVRLLGNQIWIIRLPALVPGLLMPIAVYVLGRVLYDKRVGLFAAALVAASTYLIDYSSEARGYSLIALLSILITLVLLGLLRRSRPFLWSAYAVLTAIGFFTIPTFLLAFVGAVAWFGLVVFLRKQVRIYLVPFAAWTAIAGIMTVWFYTPILIFSGLDSLIANDYVRPGNLTDTLAELPAFLARMLSLVTQEAPGFFGVLIGLGALVGCVISVGRKRSISLVSIVMFGCALVLLLVERRIPFERVWTYLFAYYYLVASAGLWWLLEQVIIRVGEAHRNLLQGVFAILLAGTLLIASFNRLNRPEPPDSFPEAENIATYLAREWHPGDLVFSRFPTRAVTQYYLRQIGRSDITFAAQGREDIDSGNRFLLLIDQNSSPVEANVKQKYNNGDLVVPRLIYEYHNARVYEIIAPHPTVQ